MMGSVKVLAGAARAATAPGRSRTRRRPVARLDRPRPGGELDTSVGAAKFHTARSTVRALRQACGNRRLYPPLERLGFVTVEEVEATPDEALLRINGIGQGFIRPIRQAVANVLDLGTGGPE